MVISHEYHSTIDNTHHSNKLSRMCCTNFSRVNCITFQRSNVVFSGINQSYGGDQKIRYGYICKTVDSTLEGGRQSDLRELLNGNDMKIAYGKIKKLHRLKGQQPP